MRPRTIFAALAVVALLSLSAAARAEVTVIKAGKLVAPETGTTAVNQIIGVERERGRVAAGMYADIIAAPENPLDQIQALKRVSFVMKNGRVRRHDK